MHKTLSVPKTPAASEVSVELIHEPHGVAEKMKPRQGKAPDEKKLEHETLKPE